MFVKKFHFSTYIVSEFAEAIVGSNYTRVKELLHRKKVPVDELFSGKAAIHQSILNGDVEMVKLLLGKMIYSIYTTEYNANPNVKDAAGQTGMLC